MIDVSVIGKSGGTDSRHIFDGEKCSSKTALIVVVDDNGDDGDGDDGDGDDDDDSSDCDHHDDDGDGDEGCNGHDNHNKETP